MKSFEEYLLEAINTRNPAASSELAIHRDMALDGDIDKLVNLIDTKLNGFVHYLRMIRFPYFDPKHKDPDTNTGKLSWTAKLARIVGHIGGKSPPRLEPKTSTMIVYLLMYLGVLMKHLQTHDFNKAREECLRIASLDQRLDPAQDKEVQVKLKRITNFCREIEPTLVQITN